MSGYVVVAPNRKQNKSDVRTCTANECTDMIDTSQIDHTLPVVKNSKRFQSAHFFVEANGEKSQVCMLETCCFRHASPVRGYKVEWNKGFETRVGEDWAGIFESSWKCLRNPTHPHLEWSQLQRYIYLTSGRLDASDATEMILLITVWLFK